MKILCASRGEGKTTFLRAQVASLAARGRSAGGIAAPAVFEGDRRIGYDLVDLRDDSRRPLARLAVAPDAAPTVGGFRFNDDALSAGHTAIIAAVRDRLDVIAIDEVGPLEFEGCGWAAALEFALGQCHPQQELIVVVRPSLVDELPLRFPAALWATASRVLPPWPPSLWQ